MKKLLLFAIILSMGMATYSQVTFEKTYSIVEGQSDEAHCMIQTADGGYLLGGASYVDDLGWFDVALLKTNDKGEKEWLKTYGIGEFTIEVAYDIIETNDGGYMVVSGTDGFTGDNDVWIIKIDNNGDSLWSKHFGGSGAQYGSAGVQNSDGSYIFVGSNNGEGSAGQDDVYIVKTDEEGNVLWSKNYGTSITDYANDVQITSDGNYIVGASVNNNQDGYLLKLDANGDTIWTKIFGGALTEEIFSVKQTSDGGYVLAGRNNTEGAGNYDVWLVKTDGDGNQTWSKTFGGEKKDIGESVSITDDGGFFIVGYTESFTPAEEDSDMYWIKTDNNGDTLWTKHFGDIKDDGGYAGVQAEDGGLAGAGYFYLPGEELEFYLVKMTADGTVSVSNRLAENNQLKVYPNPVIDNAVIEFNNPDHLPYNLVVRDVSGRTIRTIQNITGNKVQFERDDLSSGFYFIELSGDCVYTSKLIVQ